MNRRSALGRVLGLGSSGSGFEHWWGQRVSAVALVPLGLWFMASVAALPSTDYWAVAAWIGETPHAILLILWLAALLYHANLGIVVVIEDYVHGSGARIGGIVLTRFACLALAVAGIYAVLQLSLAGQA